jgi:hypothetical protein
LAAWRRFVFSLHEWILVRLMRPGVPDVHITDSRDAELASYRALPVLVVVGLIFGLLSPLAMVDIMLLCVPVIGAMLSWVALRRISKDPQALGGRKMAIAGLALCLMFLAAAPADLLAHRWMIENESQQFADLWFQYLTDGQPQKAHQLAIDPAARQPLDERLWAYYRSAPAPKSEQPGIPTSTPRADLEHFVKQPVVRALLALGPKARVRFYQSGDQLSEGGNDLIGLLYAVTYDDRGERKSFFVVVQMLRRKLAEGRAGWCIVRSDVGGRPEGW